MLNKPIAFGSDMVERKPVVKRSCAFRQIEDRDV